MFVDGRIAGDIGQPLLAFRTTLNSSKPRF